MKRNSAITSRFPAYYRHDWLNKQRESLGLSISETAAKAGVKLDSARRVFLGEATNKQVYPIANFLKMDWKALHDLDLPESEYHLAVRNGRSKAAR